MPKWTKEQEQAIKQDGSNIIVSAGAGSGKTAVLSERVIDKIEKGIHVDELLILTFTRAAAEEMKDRIRKKIASNPNYKDELDRLESSYITTFDSFALSVLKKYHYMLNLPSDVGVGEETIIEEKKIEILDEVFDTLYETKDLEFAYLIKRYSLKNDNAIKESVLSIANKIEGFIDRDEYIRYLKDDFYSDENINKIVDEFKKYVESKKKILSLELENAYHYFDGDYIAKLEDILLPIINTTSLKELRAHHLVSLPRVPSGTDDEAKSVKARVAEALKDLLKLTDLGEEDKIIYDIKSTQKITTAIVKILEEYFRRLDNFKSSNNLYTFGDIAALSIRVLKENESARLELKNKFKEIMIDEYQDTNDVQETFISLIANNNVYMVGDIKQSIYRFRGSNPNIFKDKYDAYSNSDGGEKIDLIKNFRSRSEVLNNINRIFDLLMDDNLGGARYTESHEMVYGNTAYDDKVVKNFNYDFEVLEYDEELQDEFSKEEIEIFTIAKDIKDKIKSNFQVFDKDSGELRPFTYSDAVIILDRSKFFDLYKRIFEYLNIPLMILKDDNLNSSSDLMLLKNLIDLLIRIKDKDYSIEFRYDLMSIGRSHLYEYSDEYLFDILTTNNYFDNKLYKDISSIEDYNSKSIRELLEELLEKVDFYNKIYKLGEYKNTVLRIDKILSLASSLGETGYTLKTFRDYLSNIIETERKMEYKSYSGEGDSVKILTIHKSKGLEYPVCYFADLDHKFNTRELKERFIADRDFGLISAVEVEEDKDTDTVIKILYRENFIRNEIGEKIRLFYVALTRAREKMIIVLPKKETHKLEKNEVGTIDETRRMKFMSLGDFMYGVKDYLQDYYHEIDIINLKLTKDYLYTQTKENKFNTDSTKDFTVEELSMESSKIESKVFSKTTVELTTKEARKNMEFGTKMHEALELTDFKNYDDELIEDSFIKSKVEKFLNNPLLKNVKDANIYKEFEFITIMDKIEYHGIIDLMLEYDDHVDIIDYKLKYTVDDHYKDQLNGYKKYISSLVNKPINTYLYSIIDGNITEV